MYDMKDECIRSNPAGKSLSWVIDRAFEQRLKID
jgi:hypothetical protein